MIKVRPSEIHGMGVFTDSDIQTGEHVHTSVALLIPDNILPNTPLEQYAVPSDWCHQSLIALGEVSFLNDGGERANVIITNEFDEELEHTLVKIHAIKDIKAGDELVINYENVTGVEDED